MLGENKWKYRKNSMLSKEINMPTKAWEIWCKVFLKSNPQILKKIQLD